MATHSSILAWRIPWTEEPGGLQSMGSQESDTTDQLTLSPFSFFYGIYFPDQESNPGPLHWEHGVLAVGPRKTPKFKLTLFPYSTSLVSLT